MQGLDDAPEDRVDDDFGMFLGEIRDARYFLDEFRLGHAAARSIHVSLPIPEMVAESGGTGSFVFRVRLPVRAIVVRLPRPDTQAAPPLLPAQLDCPPPV